MSDIYKLQYNGMTLTYPGWNGYASWNIGPTAMYSYTTLWETTTPFNNLYSIELNDSLDNYDEYIVYGSANRDSSRYIDVQNRYVVTHDKINRGGSFYAGRWSDGSTFILVNGTDMWLSGTSGYISSSYFIGQNNNTTAWARGLYSTGRNVDVHPYKIVGVKEVK